MLRYDYYIHWNITNSCNFSCSYCVNCFSLSEWKTFQLNSDISPSIDIEQIVKRLDAMGRCLITLTGGEPFLVPNFVELVEKLTEKHTVRIDTNLSVRERCDEFVERISPDRIQLIHFSIHPEMWSDITLLYNQAKKFKERGFQLCGNYVFHPKNIARTEEVCRLFARSKIKVAPTAFIGKCGERNYPADYSNEELRLLRRFNRHHGRVNSFSSLGDKCQAGKNSFLMDEKLDIYPCNGISKKIGNLLQEIDLCSDWMICPVQSCYCRPFGPFALRIKIRDILRSYLPSRR